jgi:hypothetical protein
MLTYVLAGLLLGTVAPGPVRALQVALPRASERPATGDTLSAHVAALTAQQHFERLRLSYLPYGPSAPSSPNCDEYIGRFCYEYGDRSGRSDEPPADRPPVVKARLELLGKLDSLVQNFPAGDWLLGTRLRYRIEAGEGDSALAELNDCQSATPWWCAALRGLAQHRLQHDAAAEREFEAARRAMPAATLCRWDDFTGMLARDARREYNALACDDRMELARTGWWLAKPLFSAEGNMRRSEHDSRRVLELLAESGTNPAWLPWGDDIAELIIRFGWPSYWRRYLPALGELDGMRPQVTLYHSEPSYHFLPTIAAMRHPLRATEDDWRVLPEDSREEYSPPRGTFTHLPQQSARFLRRDSLLILTAASVGGDSALARAELLEARVVAQPHPDSAALTLYHTVSDSQFRLRSMIANRAVIVSLEIGGDSARTARARFAAPTLEQDAYGRALSDMLLFEAGGEESPTVDNVGERMLTSPQLSRNAGLGILWETYGVRRGDAVDFGLTAVADSRGFLRRVGEALRLVRKPAETRLEWPESADPASATLSRAVKLDIGSLAPGWYTLRISVSVNGGPPMERERRIEIVK